MILVACLAVSAVGFFAKSNDPVVEIVTRTEDSLNGDRKYFCNVHTGIVGLFGSAFICPSYVVVVVIRIVGSHDICRFVV